jgi:hypothetical protein
MTFLELTDLDAADLALELFFAGDADSLDDAASLAFDLQGALGEYGAEYDLDCLEWQIAAAIVGADQETRPC